MINSFIRYSPYSTSDYEKKSVKAVTSMMIKNYFFKVLKYVKVIASMII